ncbi:hypothetical protein JB92DRAFT_3102833 [Gautieria morchelliformis]|nr:hypothetical protein JB92DRAFT_3102833 [Gautieria morchelliformis]
MVTFNVKTELDIANGARGEVTHIVLDEREPPVQQEEAKIQLKYPPPYVLVKLHWTKAGQLPGLPAGVVPIVPMQKKISITVGNQQRTVTRTQLPITAAYTFTDYQSSGASSIRLLQDFDDKLFTQHPSEFLRVEDQRLEKLDAETRQWWEDRRQRRSSVSNEDR